MGGEREVTRREKTQGAPKGGKHTQIYRKLDRKTDRGSRGGTQGYGKGDRGVKNTVIRRLNFFCLFFRSQIRI